MAMAETPITTEQVGLAANRTKSTMKNDAHDGVARELDSLREMMMPGTGITACCKWQTYVAEVERIVPIKPSRCDFPPDAALS